MKKSISYSFQAVVILAVSLLVATLALAEYVEPGDVEVSTKKYFPEVQTQAGTYTYNISWQGIPVGNGTVEVEDRRIGTEEAVKVRASVQTASGVALFYKLRHTSESEFNPKTFEPYRFRMRQQENKKKRFREIVFAKNGLIRSKRWKSGRDITQTEFNSANYTLDPISAAFLARSMQLEVGQEMSFDIYNGKDRYLVTFDVEKLENVKVNGKNRKAYKVVPGVKKLTDSETTEKRLKSATLWISADEDREILKLESKVLVGKVSAILKKVVSAKNTGGSRPTRLSKESFAKAVAKRESNSPA